MTNSEYWHRRFIAVEDNLNSKAKMVAEDVKKIFDKASVDIKKAIIIWLTRIANNNEISIAEAKKLLNAGELEEFKWTVEDYIEHARDNEINRRWVKQLENASARHHISKLEAMLFGIQGIVESIYQKERIEVTTALTNTYNETKKLIKNVFEEAPKYIDENKLLISIKNYESVSDNNKLNQLLKIPWTSDNLNFSDRIWKAKDDMIADLKQELTRVCVIGESPDKAIEHMEKYVDKKIRNAKSRAATLIETESAYIHTEATSEIYEELDVEEYEIVATLDNRTSEICRAMDGKHFKVSEKKIGITAPPFHVRCRTVTAPYFDDEFTEDEKRAARDENGKTYYVPSDMTYPEWKKRFVDGSVKSVEKK